MFVFAVLLRRFTIFDFVENVIAMLDSGGFFVIHGKGRLFLTVHDAVLHCISCQTLVSLHKHLSSFFIYLLVIHCLNYIFILLISFCVN